MIHRAITFKPFAIWPPKAVLQLKLDFRMSLRDYLHHHFVDGATLAWMAGISTARLNVLIEAGAVPEPSYLVLDDYIESAAFGRIHGVAADAGRYFRPEQLRWVQIAGKAAPGQERQAVLAVLCQELRDALRDATFAQAGAAAQIKTPVKTPIAMQQTAQADAQQDAQIEQQLHSLLPHFFNGTFGLCVANPACGYAIVRKELLQAHLSALTEHGTLAAPPGVTALELQRLIDDFAAVSMPFSPAEYPRSSRKSLVDDLRNKMQQPVAA